MKQTQQFKNLLVERVKIFTNRNVYKITSALKLNIKIAHVAINGFRRYEIILNNKTLLLLLCAINIDCPHNAMPPEAQRRKPNK